MKMPTDNNLSADNVWRVRQFFLAYSSADFLVQAVPEIKRSDRNNPRPAVSETSEQLVVIDQDELLAQLVPELLCPIASQLANVVRLEMEGAE